MSASATGLWIICAVGVLGLVTAIVVVSRSARHPHFENPQRGQLRGLVQGGQHVGGGRSVAPTRDAPVPEGGGEPPTIEQEVAAHEGRDGPSGPEKRTPRGSGSPMDL